MYMFKLWRVRRTWRAVRLHDERRPLISTVRTPGQERTCICGALLDDDDSTMCRKCSARSRWQRRRSDRRRHVRPGHRSRFDNPLR
jgi:hypothetical protein